MWRCAALLIQDSNPKRADQPSRLLYHHYRQHRLHTPRPSLGLAVPGQADPNSNLDGPGVIGPTGSSSVSTSSLLFPLSLALVLPARLLLNRMGRISKNGLSSFSFSLLCSFSFPSASASSSRSKSSGLDLDSKPMLSSKSVGHVGVLPAPKISFLGSYKFNKSMFQVIQNKKSKLPPNPPPKIPPIGDTQYNNAALNPNPHHHHQRSPSSSSQNQNKSNVEVTTLTLTRAPPPSTWRITRRGR